MKTRNLLLSLPILFLFLSSSCNNSPSSNETTSSSPQRKDSASSMPASAAIKEEDVTYAANGVNMNGFVAYSDSIKGKRPAVLIVHEWWGLTDYPRNRARQLAQLGYVAMAVDMYGGGKTASDPQEAQKLAGPFYAKPQLTKERLDAAIAKVKQLPQVDTSQIAAIGYCYGGYVVLNAAKLGADLKGVASFHGDLSGVTPDKKLLKSRILVCHGAADSLVPQAVVTKFKHQMDSVGANYTFKSYPGAVHAFTNPAATDLGKKFKIPISYNEAADKNSWNDLMTFLGQIFH